MTGQHNIGGDAPNNPEREHKGSLQLPGGWTKHAPPGGITVGGQYFKGGQFIPNDILDKASPAEIVNLKKAIEIAKKYGPKEAKKILGKFKYSKPNSASQNSAQKLNMVQQHVYVIDDGIILGKKDYFGVLVIRNNTDHEPSLYTEEISLLASLKTKQLDIVVASIQKVLSITSESGQWPQDISSKPEENLLPALQKRLNINTVPLDQYTLINNLSPQIKKVLIPEQNSPTENSVPNQEQIPPQTPTMTEGSSTLDY